MSFHEPIAPSICPKLRDRGERPKRGSWGPFWGFTPIMPKASVVRVVQTKWFCCFPVLDTQQREEALLLLSVWLYITVYVFVKKYTTGAKRRMFDAGAAPVFDFDVCHQESGLCNKSGLFHTPSFTFCLYVLDESGWPTVICIFWMDRTQK